MNVDNGSPDALVMEPRWRAKWGWRMRPDPRRFIYRLLVALCAVGLVASPVAQEPTLASPSPDGRIIGGQEVSWDEDYSFMAALMYESQEEGIFVQYCGASVVAASWVLTAAHCVDFVDEELLEGLWVGVARPPGSDPAWEPRRVASVHVHPDWDTRVSNPDIALVELRRPVPWIDPIVVADSEHDWLETPGTELTVTGWGDSEYPWGRYPSPGPPSGLRGVVVPVVADADCDKAYRGFVTVEDQLCAGERFKDSCHGDSGGPLFGIVDETPVQVGVVSYGFQCAKQRFPGVYAEVNSPTIRPFIADVAAF